MENLALLLAAIVCILMSVLVASLFRIQGVLSRRERVFFVSMGLLTLMLFGARIAFGAIALVNLAAYAWAGVLLLGLWWLDRKRRQEGDIHEVKPLAWQKRLVWIIYAFSFLIGVTYWLR